MSKLPLVVAVLAGLTGVAHAGVINLVTETITDDIGAAAPLGVTASLGSTNGGDGGGTLTGDTLFTVPVAGMLQITVTDLGTTASPTPRSGSAYEVILDQVVSLGTTPSVAVDGPAFSTITFPIINVLAGSHVLGVWDFFSTYVGEASPFDGQLVSADFSQANVFVRVDELTPNPVPAPGLPAWPAFALLAVLVAKRRRSVLSRSLSC